jgi:hypothetical protein
VFPICNEVSASRGALPAKLLAKGRMGETLGLLEIQRLAAFCQLIDFNHLTTLAEIPG